MDKIQNPAPVKDADPATPATTAGEQPPAEGIDGGGIEAVGNADGADANPPTNAAEAEDAKGDAGKAAPKGETKAAAKKADEKAAKTAVKALPKGSQVMVWCQAGHPSLAIGKVIALPGEKAEQLREVGRARYAAEAEIVAAGEDILVLEDL